MWLCTVGELNNYLKKKYKTEIWKRKDTIAGATFIDPS